MVDVEDMEWKDAPDWMIRVGQEWCQVGGRINALENFLFGEETQKVLETVSDIELTMLKAQMQAMTAYEQILEARMMLHGLEPSKFPTEWMLR